MVSIPEDQPERCHRSRTSWCETGMLVAGAGLLLLVMTKPAFNSFFIGENFVYVGQYRSHGNNFWAAVFSPIVDIFFRPVFCAVSLVWHFVLPMDPWTYHVRNFVFSVINLLLLHRLLVKLVLRLTARILAFSLFAVSKVHLTTIGYINIYDSILTLMLLLLVILFFIRYAESGGIGYYVLALGCSILSVFSKDYGLVAVGVVVALVTFWVIAPEEWRTQAVKWSLRLSPLLAMVVFYLAVRYFIVGPLPASNPVYSPRVSLEVTARKVLIFSSSIWNISLINRSATGDSGLWAWLARSLLGLELKGAWVDAVFYVILTLLLAGTLVIGRRAGKRLLFPAAWIAAYFVPALLTRNQQIYYVYEALAGMSALVGMCLDQASRRLLSLWGVALVIVSANGTFSNYKSIYFWQEAANAAEQLRKPVLEAHRGEPIKSITFVTASQPFWQWALTADSYGPLIPELMGLPNLKVNVISGKNLVKHATSADHTNLVFDIDNGFAQYHAQDSRSP